MNIGIFLGIGESLKQMEKSGQKDRFIGLYLKRYAKNFDKVYLFSYADEADILPSNVILVPNNSSFHRYLYAILTPIINRKQIKDCAVIRGFGLTSFIPSIFAFKPFVFNYPYDYCEFLKIKNKYIYIPFFYLLEKIAFFRAKIVFIATKQKIKKLHNQKYTYLPNGVDLNLFKEQKLLGKGLVFVGRLEKQKNLFFLLDAVSNLQKKDRRITFIGTGLLKNELCDFARKKNIELTVSVPVKNFQLPKVLSRFSIFTLTSLAEGSPKVLLEAMAMGLVPIVTNFSTASEVIKNKKNGFITNFDSNLYSKQIQLLLENKKLTQKISKVAKQSIVNNFNFEKIVAFEISILKQTAINNTLSKGV